MIKQAEINSAYQQGVQAALIKLSQSNVPITPLEFRLPGQTTVRPWESLPEAEGSLMSIYNPYSGGAPTPAMLKKQKERASEEPEEELELAQEIVPPEGTNALINFIENQKLLARNIGLGTGGFTRNQHARDIANAIIPGSGRYAPQTHSGLTNLLTAENMGRLGMLGGAVGGTLLGDRNLRSAALSTAGAVGGGMVGANLASGINKAVLAYKNPGYDLRDQQRNLGLGGLVGGLTGGLAAGRYL